MTSSELKSKLEDSIQFLRDEMSKIRTGRASPSLLEQIKVNAYGSKMTLKELGSISVLDAQSLVVSPWDKSLLKDINKAITESDLGLNPSIDGEVVRVPIPDLTEERRKELTKTVTNKIEEVKNSIRNIRQDAMKDIDNEFENKEITEDDKFTLREQVEETVKEFTEKASQIGEDKKNDLLKI